MYEVRNATAADAVGIAKVHILTWQVAYKDLIPDSYLRNLSVPKRTEAWSNQLQIVADGTRYFVAEEDGKIVGFATVGKSGDEDAAKTVGEIYAIYVLPERQGLGIGSALHKTSIEALASDRFEEATLWVLESNHPSRNWYESRGWQLEGALKIEQKGDFQLHEIRYVLDLAE